MITKPVALVKPGDLVVTGSGTIPVTARATRLVIPTLASPSSNLRPRFGYHMVQFNGRWRAFHAHDTLPIAAEHYVVLRHQDGDAAKDTWHGPYDTAEQAQASIQGHFDAIDGSTDDLDQVDSADVHTGPPPWASQETAP